MRKNYFYTSLIFTILSVVIFWTGTIYGFTSEIFYFFKPVTVFQYTTFLAFAFFITSFRETLKKSPRLELYFIIGFLVAMASFYEIFFNFFYWFSLYNFYGLGTNLDALKNLVPYNVLFNQTTTQILQKSGLYPVNLNFASKVSVLIFFCSLYWIYFINNLRKNKSLEKF
jgi:hypothetical protein